MRSAARYTEIYSEDVRSAARYTEIYGGFSAAAALIFIEECERFSAKRLRLIGSGRRRRLCISYFRNERVLARRMAEGL